MQKFNYHAHTYRCKHASGSEEEYIHQAIKAGYEVFGFSEHAPFWQQDNVRNRMDYSSLPEYLDTIHALNKKYAGQISIPCGVEMDSYLADTPIMQEFFDKMDYVILSVHGKSQQQPFYFAHEKTQEDILLYGAMVEEALPKGNWLYLAHPDYYMRKETKWTAACEETAHRICAAAVKNNTILEMNLTGMHEEMMHYPQGDFYFYPNYYFWEIAQQYPLKVVYGLDAHNTKVIQDTQCFEIIEEEFKTFKLDFVKNPLI